MKSKACIILPTYNEAGNISNVISGIYEQQKQISTHELYVLVVDDNSPDGTAEIVKRLQGKYRKLELVIGSNQGLGEAYKLGMKYAIDKIKPDLIFEMDSDGQHDPGLIPLFITLTENNFDLVIGSRYTHGGLTPVYSIYRKLFSIFGNWLVRILGGVRKLHDCTSGFRCIKIEFIKKCNLKKLSSRGYSFQASLLCELIRNGARTIEVPITFPNRKFGRTKLTVKDQFDFVFNILSIRVKRSEEFIKFCFVGASGVFVNLGIYIILNRFIGIRKIFAYPIAIEASIITNFLLNNYWSFKKRETQIHFISKLLKFHVVSGIGGLINFGVFTASIKVFGIYDLIASCLGIMIATMINYILNSLWTWPKKQNL